MTLRSLACLSLTALLPLAACAQANITPPPFGSDIPCGADRLEALVGQPVHEIEKISWLSDTLRIIRLGDAVTEDYSEQRLNVQLDKVDRITDLWCG
jgi:Peptidase inhibitor I78 family